MSSRRLLDNLEAQPGRHIFPLPLGHHLGFGILACGNAVGDMVSSLYVGLLLEAGYTTLAFGIAAGVGALGVGWMVWIIRQRG